VRVGRVARRAGQVHIQLAIGELTGDVVRDVHREGGLADAASARDRGDDQRDELPVAAGEHGCHRTRLLLAAREVGGGGRELGRRGGTGDGRVPVPGQHPLVEMPQLLAGIDTEFIGQELTQLVVAGDCLGLAPGTGQGGDEAAAHAFPQRVGAHPAGQPLRNFLVAAEPQSRRAKSPASGSGTGYAAARTTAVNAAAAVALAIR
jgi:hypothetical protein